MAEDSPKVSVEELKQRLALQEVEIGLLSEKKQFLEDEEAIQGSKLALAKERLEVLRKATLAMGDLKNLSEDDKKSLKLRIKMLQQTVQLEGKRVESIKESQQASENLSSITGNYFSQITLINDGWRQTALGGLLQASMTAKGLEGTFKKMGEAIKNLPMQIFANIMGEIEQKTVQMFNTIMSSTAELVKATGLIDQNFGKQIQDLGGQFTNMALGVEEARESIYSLYTGFSNFRNLDKRARESLKKTTMTLKGLGVDGGTAVKFMDDAMLAFGLSTGQAEQAAMRFVNAARSMKQTADQLMDAMAPFAGELAAFKDGITTFIELSKAADKAGIKVQELMKISRQFDTFKGAARAVHQLNAALGQNAIDMQTMMSLQPEERADKIRSVMLNSGKDFETMGHMQKKFFATAAGFTDVGEMMKFLRGETEKGKDEFKEYGLTQKQVEEIAKKSKTAMQVLQTALQQLAMDVAPLVQLFADIAGGIAKFLSTSGGKIILWAGLAFGAFILLKKGFTALKTAASVVKGGVAVASITAQATANGLLAASITQVGLAATAAAGPLSAMTIPMAIIGISIAVVVVALADLLKHAIDANVPLIEVAGAFAILAGSVGLLAFAFASVAAGSPVTAIGIVTIAAAILSLGLSLAFVSTDDLQALATIFQSIAKTTATNPFGTWISGIKEFATSASSVTTTIAAVGKAMGEFQGGAANIRPVTALITSIGNIDDNGVKGLTEATTLVRELRVAVDNQSTQALQNLVDAFTNAANGTPAAGAGSRNIIIELDGREVGRFVAKEMDSRLKNSSPR